jgi:dihydroflavonol-4-reductase
MTKHTVCVTGANGFLASHLIKQLLEKGYTVHGTVRSVQNKKNNFLFELPNAKENLKLFEADLVTEGTFDEAVKGCAEVYHTATPVTLVKFDDPVKELVEPAVNGTLNVLKSCAKNSTIRRVVITSSGASIYDPSMANESRLKPLTENDWNNVSTISSLPYYYSKAKAEQAAWNFIDQHKNDISFDLVTIIPPVISGPVLHKDKDQLNLSVLFYSKLAQELKNNEPIAVNGYARVDVRDVAAAHILAGESSDPKVSNQRFITTVGSYTNPTVARMLISVLPNEFKGVELKLNGDEQYGFENQMVRFDNSKFLKTFPSFKYIDFEISLIDTYNNLKELNAV